ncbi:Ldh family oxidoreductase [Dysosmobacter sp.]|uniref:Ldh family oxidoreductase n=1 Tax=Dysosmobacter sp. TaxID=2591382 RepID=UPI002A89E94C|nr:Ldh family oxidoreductase [Dysosmobacter sp.]MDY3280764.1 Ldh family oxidoreductase [Dysosmobacter sp.]
MKNFRPEVLEEYCKNVLTASGVDEGCARTVARSLLDAELTGVSTHGVSRMGIYLQRLNAGLVSRENRICIVRESPSAVVIDAGNTLGAPSARFAMETCIRKAAETGCCFATVRNSNHFGTAAFYTRMAAERGMVGFACTNLTGKIAPYGSAEPFMGTDPISVAAPSETIPLVLDMTPSVVALGKLILAQKLGQPIPLGWALDREGNPTTDPAEGRKGSLIPIGGPKGSGLAIMVEVLSGVLSGAGCGPHLHDLYEFDAPQGVGHFLGAIDVSHFLDPAAFRSGLSQMVREIKGLRKAPGAEEILLPGERAARSAAAKQETGIDLPDPVYEELAELGRPYGLTL